MNSKVELRQVLKDFRRNMPADERESKARLIASRLIDAVDWRALKNIHIYKAEASWHEIDTAPIVEWLSANYPVITVVQPSSNRYQSMPKTKFDLIVIPVLGFDKSNHRLGFGGGYYDRFLAAQPQALKIGLAYQGSLIKDGLPRESHDIALDKVITEI